MATDLKMPYVKQALTADGSAAGFITVASTTGFRKGARVLLKDDVTDAIELVIDEVVSATQLAVRDPSKIGTMRYDCSAYLLAENAAVTQNEQADFYTRQWMWF